MSRQSVESKVFELVPFEEHSSTHGSRHVEKVTDGGKKTTKLLSMKKPLGAVTLVDSLQLRIDTRVKQIASPEAPPVPDLNLVLAEPVCSKSNIARLVRKKRRAKTAERPHTTSAVTSAAVATSRILGSVVPAHCSSPNRAAKHSEELLFKKEVEARELRVTRSLNEDSFRRTRAQTAFGVGVMRSEIRVQGAAILRERLLASMKRTIDECDDTLALVIGNVEAEKNTKKAETLSAMLRFAVGELRLASVNTVEAIVAWRRRGDGVGEKVFAVEGHPNYLLKMSRDTLFLTSAISFRRALQITHVVTEENNDPFLLPNREDSDSDSEAEMDPTYLKRIFAAAEVLHDARQPRKHEEPAVEAPPAAVSTSRPTWEPRQYCVLQPAFRGATIAVPLKEVEKKRREQKRASVRIQAPTRGRLSRRGQAARVVHRFMSRSRRVVTREDPPLTVEVEVVIPQAPPAPLKVVAPRKKKKKVKKALSPFRAACAIQRSVRHRTARQRTAALALERKRQQLALERTRSTTLRQGKSTRLTMQPPRPKINAPSTAKITALVRGWLCRCRLARGNRPLTAADRRDREAAALEDALALQDDEEEEEDNQTPSRHRR